MKPSSTSPHQVLQQCSVLGAIEGSDLLEERKRSATETSKRPVDGLSRFNTGMLSFPCVTTQFHTGSQGLF